LKMNFLILVLLFCQAFFCSTNAASHNKILVQEDRTIILNKVIENGKSSNVETDRHMHLDWDRFRQLKSEYDSKFDELICTDPDQLRDMHRELDELSKKVELGWNLKQEQLDDLVDVLHNENYNATGLSTGNEGVDDLCQGLQEYIDKVNHTAWEDEKPELDGHLQEVIDIEIAIDTHPCPCVWAEWSIWSDCSTTCEAGERNRNRAIFKDAINNGRECEGDTDESEVCNDDVCCPVNCVWNLWEEWNACPSGCDQHTTRTRTKAVVAICNGTDCTGEDFQEKSCSRERELEDEIAVLQQQIDQCQGTVVTCKLTVDNEIKTVSYNGITLSVTGDKRNWQKENTIQFETGKQANTNRLTVGVLRIEGEDWELNNGANCIWGGLLLHCQAEDTSSPWHNFKSDTDHWQTLDGSEVCSNSEGFVSIRHSGNIPFIRSLLASGAKKIWSDQKKVTLIGSPSVEALYH